VELLEWNDQYILGFTLLDEHHQHLVNLLNSSYEAVKLNNIFTVRAILDELTEYTAYHFAAEEKYMLESGYPGMEAHIREHVYFSTQVKDFIGRVNVEEPLHKVTIVTFLREWLLNHILKVDREFVGFLAAKGMF
jgi:hemerythrin